MGLDIYLKRGNDKKYSPEEFETIKKSKIFRNNFFEDFSNNDPLSWETMGHWRKFNALYRWSKDHITDKNNSFTLVEKPVFETLYETLKKVNAEIFKVMKDIVPEEILEGKYNEETLWPIWKAHLEKNFPELYAEGVKRVGELYEDDLLARNIYQKEGWCNARGILMITHFAKTRYNPQDFADIGFRYFPQLSIYRYGFGPVEYPGWWLEDCLTSLPMLKRILETWDDAKNYVYAISHN